MRISERLIRRGEEESESGEGRGEKGEGRADREERRVGRSTRGYVPTTLFSKASSGAMGTDEAKRVRYPY